MAPPANLAQAQPSTFTRRPVQKTEYEQRIEEAELEKKVSPPPTLLSSFHRKKLCLMATSSPWPRHHRSSTTAPGSLESTRHMSTIVLPASLVRAIPPTSPSPLQTSLLRTHRTIPSTTSALEASKSSHAFLPASPPTHLPSADIQSRRDISRETSATESVGQLEEEASRVGAISSVAVDWGSIELSPEGQWRPQRPQVMAR
jgi:hypothetical protein